MKEVKVDCGYRIEDKETIQYIGEQTDNCMCYKDISAWENGNGVIYISECELEDLENGKNHSDLWTRETWLAWVEEHLKGNDLYHENGCAEYIASIVLQDCDWQCLSTLLEEIDIEEDIKCYLFDECIKYCREHFDTNTYDVNSAFSRMAMQRCDLKMADYMVYNHISNLIDDFIQDYEITQEWFDDNIGIVDDIALDILQKIE